MVASSGPPSGSLACQRTTRLDLEARVLARGLIRSTFGGFGDAFQTVPIWLPWRRKTCLVPGGAGTVPLMILPCDSVSPSASTLRLVSTACFAPSAWST
jgi:hypothetical protein